MATDHIEPVWDDTYDFIHGYRAAKTEILVDVSATRLGAVASFGWEYGIRDTTVKAKLGSRIPLAEAAQPTLRRTRTERARKPE